MFIFVIIGFFGLQTAASADIAGMLKTVLRAGNSVQELKHWSTKDFSNLKKISTREKDPGTGKLVNFKGIRLSELIEKSIDQLPPEQKAQVDLVILKDKQGNQALVPRALVQKYPIIVAIDDSQKIDVVMPWTSSPKILSEDLPLEKYSLSAVNQIELANYRDRYASFFLKRRTDPAAMRGEKIFVQNCMSCHVDSQSLVESKARTLASAEHPAVKGNPKLTPRDRRSLVSYLDAYQGENSRQAKR